jgi:BlaI family penicillinase repressor
MNPFALPAEGETHPHADDGGGCRGTIPRRSLATMSASASRSNSGGSAYGPFRSKLFRRASIFALSAVLKRNFNVACRLHSAYHHSRITNENSRSFMALPKLTKLELQIMEALWSRGALSIREIQEAFPEPGRPAYTTVQTTVYRLETKKALRRVKKISNAHIFEAVVSRNAAQNRLIDDLLALFGGRSQPVMSHLIESGKLTLDDVQEAQKTLRRLAKKEKS